MACVLVIGTFDTKREELLFLADVIRQTPGASSLLIDVGVRPVQHPSIALSSADLVSKHTPHEPSILATLPRGEYVNLVSECAAHAVRDLLSNGRIHGVVSAGGSSNTSLVSSVMRAVLPVGFPKLIVSTMASGDTGSIVGESDIALMYSVVDVAGLNSVLRDVLCNAGAAIAASSLSYASRSREQQPLEKRRVGITMFGVTTPGVDKIRAHLESHDIEAYVFHATGHGGRAMEKFIREGRIDAVIDLTTTEICDHLMGGVLSAGEARLDAAVERGLPGIVSLGALDMCNFGPVHTVPEKYRGRKIHVHNPDVTLLRTSADECLAIGRFICDKLTRARDPGMLEVWIPRGGLSMISVPGGPFADAEADQALFDTIDEGLRGTGIKVVQDERHVNDEGFARDIAEALVAKMGLKGHK